MAASTITRDTWTNDTGTPLLPNGDGTLLNNSVLQNHIYARIDAMFAGAGAYTTFTLGGILSAEGFGTHLFSAGGTGGNLFRIRNTTAGSTNFAAVEFGNDATGSAAAIYCLSSTYTTSGYLVQDSMVIDTTRGGGLSIVSSHVNGGMRFYVGGSTERARLTNTGQLLVGDTSNADFADAGLTVKSADGKGMALKYSGLARAAGVFETDTFGQCSVQGGNGGLKVYGAAQAAHGTQPCLELGAHGDTGTGDTTKSVTGQGFVVIRAQENNAGIGVDENILAVINHNTTRFILDADGDSHQDVGTAWTNYDDHDDLALLHALSAGVSRTDDPLRQTFGRFLAVHKATLERSRIVTFNKDGHHFINWSRAHMLAIGAIRQIGMRQLDILARLDALEAA